jgi:hypothetical protein
MGWKALKEKFGIEHHIEITNEGICIGSGYVPNLVIINPETGEITESKAFGGFLREKYPALLEAKPEDLVELIKAPDVFTKFISVYTYENGEVVEKKCEELGWPNTTHDGCMMYENTYSTDKDEVIKWAKNNSDIAIKYMQEDIMRKMKELAECHARLDEEKAKREKLENLYATV